MAICRGCIHPGDEGTRGLNARHFLPKSRWIKGPDFLWESENHWPEQDSYEKEHDPSSPEVKKITVNTTVAEEKRGYAGQVRKILQLAKAENSNRVVYEVQIAAEDERK